MHTIEHELVVDDYDTAGKLLLGCELHVSRTQEKKRHSFRLGECLVEFDTWPGIPTYVEIEGPSIAALQATAEQLNLDWNTRYEKDALALIDELYNLDLEQITEFTFEHFPEVGTQ